MIKHRRTNFVSWSAGTIRWRVPSDPRSIYYIFLQIVIAVKKILLPIACQPPSARLYSTLRWRMEFCFSRKLQWLQSHICPVFPGQAAFCVFKQRSLLAGNSGSFEPLTWARQLKKRSGFWAYAGQFRRHDFVRQQIHAALLDENPTLLLRWMGELILSPLLHRSASVCENYRQVIENTCFGFNVVKSRGRPRKKESSERYVLTFQPSLCSCRRSWQIYSELHVDNGAFDWADVTRGGDSTPERSGCSGNATGWFMAV